MDDKKYQNINRLARRKVQTARGYAHMLTRLAVVTHIQFSSLRQLRRDTIAYLFVQYSTGGMDTVAITNFVSHVMYDDPEWRRRYQTAKAALNRWLEINGYAVNIARQRALRRILSQTHVDKRLFFAVLERQGYEFARKANTIDSPEWILATVFGN